MTFREALQSEINLQGLSVARIAETSKVSKGAIYNILNGTTENERIRPATRKALALACDRDVVQDGEGVAFVARGGEAIRAPGPAAPEMYPLIATWQVDRPFLTEGHIGQAFDWLHRAEQEETVSGINVVDRVYQKRSDFLSVTCHNKGADVVDRIALRLRVQYVAGDLVQDFSAAVLDSVPPGAGIEQTVFVCVGPAYELSLTSLELTTSNGQVYRSTLPDAFSFSGGQVD